MGSGILLFIIAIVITFIIMSIDAKQKMKNYQMKSDSYLSTVNFSVSKRVPIDLFNQNRLEFLVDNDSEKFGILSCKPDVSFLSGEEHISEKSFSLNIFDFSDITNFELVLDNDEVLQGRGLAATGGSLLFGVAGAVIGASGKKNIIKKNRSIVINIYLNKIDCPLITINFPVIQDFDSLSDGAYNKILEDAQTIKGILYCIQQHNDKLKSNNNSENDVTNKIKQLNELKEQGLISKDEFNNKKKELLDNL